MNLLVFGNSIFNYPALIRQAGFRLGTVFVYIAGERVEMGFNSKYFTVASLAIRMIKYTRQSKNLVALGDWASVKFSSCFCQILSVSVNFKVIYLKKKKNGDIWFFIHAWIQYKILNIMLVFGASPYRRT